MSSSHLLALLPPPDMAARITQFRAAHDLRDAAATPHITVKARSGLTADLTWLPAARAVAATHAPVPVTLGGPHVFRNGSALHLHVHSPGALHLHLALLDALRPAQQFGYEGPHMTLHLSVALARPGLNLSALQDAARAIFADLHDQPLTFTAPAMVWLTKPGPGEAYAPVETWPLAGPDPHA
ncbi:2'-5' RNA ligase family protein [Deinococcus taeanensis]|uniref:2'-5' RNA ligase family protein n=1 Tax=Deinococcus taeanensis TaxID=2737050 RepID=UPI001CDD0EEF|nr:2'-5' RNA ligase family protein [Deinococcus taeanensis]UBV41977.1 2'-5' RNA ligase family protein [Deinococcus taeanensis]